MQPPQVLLLLSFVGTPLRLRHLRCKMLRVTAPLMALHPLLRALT